MFIKKNGDEEPAFKGFGGFCDAWQAKPNAYCEQPDEGCEPAIIQDKSRSPLGFFCIVKMFIKKNGDEEPAFKGFGGFYPSGGPGLREIKISASEGDA